MKHSEIVAAYQCGVCRKLYQYGVDADACCVCRLCGGILNDKSLALTDDRCESCRVAAGIAHVKTEIETCRRALADAEKRLRRLEKSRTDG